MYEDTSRQFFIELIMLMFPILISSSGCQDQPDKVIANEPNSSFMRLEPRADSGLRLTSPSLIGMWKMDEVDPPRIRLPNLQGDYTNLTLDFQVDSVLKVYLDGRRDSIAEYYFTPDSSGFRVKRGDVVSTGYVNWVMPSEVLLYGILKPYDTFRFKRVVSEP
ncbi:MAG: hypothetical protein EOO88_01325 [Pedobacter sp.]|nr:MAG: hypothetical protein EOO88_01325 [Pedobacter sp.]